MNKVAATPTSAPISAYKLELPEGQDAWIAQICASLLQQGTARRLDLVTSLLVQRRRVLTSMAALMEEVDEAALIVREGD